LIQYKIKYFDNALASHVTHKTTNRTRLQKLKIKIYRN
jgi:hypothetical protein